jgi:hypothetical protein
VVTVLTKNVEFLDISSLLGQGFFADKVVQILCKAGPITTKDESVLNRVKIFLKNVSEGQKEVRTERLSCESIETIDAYQRALFIFNQVLRNKSEEMTAERFHQLMENMSGEVEQVLKNRKVTSNERTTLEFFKLIQRQTIDETSESLGERAALKWPKPATFYSF